jgi:membrane associated rhomboid family serine protease
MRLEADSEIPSSLQDLIGLVAIAALLAAIHFLAPPTLKEALVFDHTRFRGYTLFTAAFVHTSNLHLYGNLLGYALTIVYAYALCLYSDGFRWFRRTTLAVLLIVPIMTNLTSYAIFSWQYPASSPVSRGFSGVVAGFGGMLLVALYRFIRLKFNKDLAWAVGLSLFLLLMQLIDLRYAGGLRLSVTGLVLLGIALVFGSYLFQHDIVLDERADVERVGIAAVVVALVGVVLAVLVLGLFPQAEALVEDGQFTNVFAHAAGFLWGIAVSTTMYLLLRRDIPTSAVERLD